VLTVLNADVRYVPDLVVNVKERRGASVGATSDKVVPNLGRRTRDKVR